ncbi:hypothetical protein [Enterococcus nangangensis]|uniref:hypothetical protein n=1 Tax=Enterococcus nangangensis TaxID=2559926 RepID=UPI0010F7357D|nr:hypothetical protein [Enterococcus nangangensis]
MKTPKQIEARKEMLKLMNADDEWYKHTESPVFNKIQELAKLLETPKAATPTEKKTKTVKKAKSKTKKK